MTRRVWFFVVPLAALLVFAARTLLHRSSVPAVVASTPPDVVARTAAVPHKSQPPYAPEGEDVASRPRVIASPVFSRLPPSDQHWVLAQARARVKGADDPRLGQVVHELSEVRLFVVSEREEPLAPLDPSR